MKQKLNRFLPLLTVMPIVPEVYVFFNAYNSANATALAIIMLGVILINLNLLILVLTLPEPAQKELPAGKKIPFTGKSARTAEEWYDESVVREKYL